MLASAKGHEYFLKHYLGTHTNAIAEDLAKDSVTEVVWRDEAPRGKLDLVVDLNFRMDTSALYSDIILPAATWYEKADLNTTDLHSLIHPLSAALLDRFAIYDYTPNHAHWTAWAMRSGVHPDVIGYISFSPSAS